MTQVIVPRPVAWILSCSGDAVRAAPEDLNLAPFSYFNAIASEPPLVMVSIGLRPDGGDKDTRRNLVPGAPCVVHLPSVAQIDAVNESSRALPHGQSEVSALGLTLCEFPGSPLPRLADCRVALAARVERVLEVGSHPQAVIFLELTQLYVDDDCVLPNARGRAQVSPSKLDPLVRLGGTAYAALGACFDRQRPE